MSDVTETLKVLSSAAVALFITLASFVAVANPLGGTAPVHVAVERTGA